MTETFRVTLRRALRRAGKQSRRLAVGALLILAAIGVAVLAFLLHVNLSTAGSLELLVVLLVALRLGLFQATIVSIAAFLCLNFLFTAPIFTFTVDDPRNWVSLFTFEVTALLVSGLSSKVRLHAERAEQQRVRAVKLYELGRAVLLIDQLGSTGDQLSSLVREILEVGEVGFWVSYENSRLPTEPTPTKGNEMARDTFVAGQDSDDFVAGVSQRLLRLGASTIGAMTMSGWKIDPLTADAVASLAAIIFERARAVQQENRAQLERDAEQLRTAVLDGLAHSFKTPLTAIQTASSGLLAIDQLSATQAELVQIIDERATMLGQLTTRLLQTAALEAKQIRLRRTRTSMLELVHEVVGEQDEDTRARIRIGAPEKLRDDQLDPTMVGLALQQLVDNAAKYSAIGSPIEITIGQIPSETVVAVKNIKMAGSSIRPQERTRIFERFYRGIDAVYGPAGTGLGLSIAKKTAEAHGGRVWVECLDETTRFIFAIQRYKREESD